MMTGKRFFKALLVASALMTAVPAGAQSGVSSSDIQRLQDDVYQASTDVSRLRSTDANAAARLQDDLDALRDEVIYLKVKMRKEGSVNRSEYTDVRDRLQSLRSQARGESSGTSLGSRSSGSDGRYSSERPVERPPDSRRSSQSAIPSGQEIDVRLQTPLSSDTAQVEDRFEATTVADLYQGNTVLIPAGSVMRGIVSAVDKATRTDRKGSLTVSFDRLTVRGRDYPMRGTVTHALESEGIRGEAGRIAAGSAVGAIIGGIVGGVKGAVIGVLIGGGGTMVATEGKDVKLDAGTIFRVRMDSPPDIR
jgi:hypothetical protein